VPFEFRPYTSLPEVILIEPKEFADERGWFAETFKKSDFAEHGIPFEFPQDNHSCSTGRGVLRGLHFQKEPVAQGKLVRCLVGEAFDVAVDIRLGSPTYAKWVSTNLSARNHHILWVPAGFAHGFLTLTDDTEIAYKVTSEFSASHDRTIRWSDPTIGIKWPITNPILSMKDRNAPLLSDVDNNFVWNEGS
jgi:dTDP-4-dehydrorhamnose 3,5-epimerase